MNPCPTIATDPEPSWRNPFATWSWAGVWVPFSQKNLRFTTLLIGVVVLTTMSIFGVVQVFRTPAPSPAMLIQVTGIPSMILVQLLAMLRVEQDNSKTRHDIKGEIAPVRHNVEYVAHKLENGGKPLSVSRDELKQLVREIVTEVCYERDKPQ